MTVSTLIKRLAEFVESESGSTEITICGKDGTNYPIISAEKFNTFGEIHFGILINKEVTK